jgi:hypothetical protein
MNRIKTLPLVLALIISPLIGILSKRGFDERSEALVRSCASFSGQEYRISLSPTLYFCNYELSSIRGTYSIEVENSSKSPGWVIKKTR